MFCYVTMIRFFFCIKWKLGKNSDSQMGLREKRNCESQDGNFEAFKA